ncbi:MAG TPA: hypothetical protein VH593_19855, partial [Ktedonobacteraceae bacterium]
MSVRTWNAGKGQNAALFAYMIFFGLIAIWGTATTKAGGFPMMFGLAYTLMILSSWFVVLFYRLRRRPP